MPVLKLLSSDGRRVVREFPITSTETTIGRSTDNEVVLADESVSRRHARLLVTSRGYQLVDLGSANGLWIRNEMLRDGMVAAGELFRVGNCVLQIVEDQAGPAASVARRGGSSRSGLWAALLLVLVASGACMGGLLLYLMRGAWMPSSPASAAETPVAAQTPTVAETPCPPPDAHLCPWTYKTPTTTASECPPGFCWDGGPMGTSSCKQQALAEHSHRTRWSDVFCDEGFTPVLSRCSNAIERCAGP